MDTSMISVKRFWQLCIVLMLGSRSVFATTPLTLGTTYGGSIALPGQTNGYTFTATAGQRVFLDSLDVDNLQINAMLLSPGGTILYQRNDDYDGGPWVATEPGNYTLVFSANGSTTGSYSFRLLDLAAASQISVNTTISDQLSPPLSCNVYRFNGTHGQRVDFHYLSSSTNQASWQLVTPANVILAYGQIYQDLGILTLPIDGSYSLMVIGTAPGTTPLTYDLQITDVSDAPVAASGFGVTQSGTVNGNSTNSFAFTAPAGLPVFFDSQDKSGVSLIVDFVDPTGKAVFSVGETADAGPYVLPRSGAYTLNVRGAGGASGNFSFRVLDLSTSPVLALNTTVNNALNAPYQTDVYQLTGTPGQRLYYDSLAGATPSVQLRLLGPDGQFPISTPYYFDAGPASLSFAGTHYLFLQSDVSTSTPYQFKMFDVGTQPAVPINSDFSGTLSPNSALIYTLSGTAGQDLYFYGKSPSSAGTSWILYNSRNASIAGASIAGDFPITLPYSGAYTLVFAAPNSSVNYSNRVGTFALATNALSLGTIVSNNIVNPGDQLVYTFSGTAGQRLYYDALIPYTGSLNVYLVSPTGVNVIGGNAASDVGPVTLPVTGTYQLVFNGASHTTGPIAFQLLDISAQPPLPLNTDLTGTLPAYTTRIYQMAGTNAEQLYFYGKAVSVGGGAWGLYAPDNSLPASAGLGGDFQLTLANPGQYALVMVAAANPITYSNQVNNFALITNALTLGTVVSNNISVPGNQLFYTFNGTAGQRIYFDALLPYNGSISVVLISPSGTTLVSSAVSVDFGPFTLPQTGSYLMQITGSGHTTGAINFQVLDVAAQPMLALNSDLTGTLPANVTRVYQVPGTAGELLYFNSKSVSVGGSSWYLYGLNGATLNGNALAGDFQQALPAAGTYVVTLQGGANTAVFSNQVNNFAFTTNALSLSTKVTTAVVHPGDQVFYTFSGTVGQRVWFDSRQTNFVNVQYTLYSPTALSLLSGNASSDAGLPITLTQNGTYTLVLSGSGDAVATCAFELQDLSAASPITAGSTITDSLTDRSEMRLYRFNGTAGQRVSLKSSGTGGNQAIWQLIGPTDQTIGATAYVVSDIGTNTLPTTGTYTVAVIGNGSTGAAVPYQWTFNDVSDSPVAAAGFGTVHSGNIGASQTNSFTYTASAGTPVLFDSQDNSGVSLLVELISPDGQTIFLQGETSDSVIYVLPRSGTYKLNVRGSNGASGNYSFRLLDLSTSPTLSFNTSVTGVVNPLETAAYKFTNIAGQNLIYNALTNDANYPAIFVQVLNPAGQAVGPGSDFQNQNIKPFMMQYAGTSYFLVKNSKTVSGNYSFQLLDVASQPALTLNASLTNQMGIYPFVAYRYSGTAGQQLYFHAQPGNPSGLWAVYDPTTAAVPGSGTSLTSDFEVTLPYTGTYALVLQPYGPTPGTNVFQAAAFSYITNSYTVDTAVNTIMGLSGERRFYSFTGSLGQRLFYNALTNDPPSPGIITVQMLNPQGAAEGPIGGRFSVNRGPFTLQESGTFNLAFDGGSASTGPLSFQLLDLATQPVLPINTPVTKTLDVYAEQIYRFNGTAGQRLYFAGQAGNPGGYWTVYDPNNAIVSGSGTSLTADFEVTLPLTGTYALALSSYSPTAGPETFQVSDYTYFTNNYTLGTQVFDVIAKPGERKFYTFTGSVGQRLFYNALTNDPVSGIISAQLITPSGTVDGSIGGRFSINRGPFTLTQSGTYTLIMDGNGASTGAFAFRLLDLAVQPALPLSAGVTNLLGVYPVVIYQYSGLPGQRLYFRGLAGNPSGNWYLYDPNNTGVSGSSLVSDFQVTLPMSGTYALVISSFDTSTKTEVFAVNPFNASETPSINRAPVLTHITNQVAGVGIPISFTAKATDPDNNTLTFSLDPGAPAGATIDAGSGLFAWNPPITGLSSVTPVTVRVTDNGNPSLSSAQTLTMEVIAGPSMITVKRTPGVANVSWHSAPTKHYRLQYKNNLADPTWLAVGSDVTATDIITIQADPNIGTNAWRFYRIQALDPLP